MTTEVWIKRWLATTVTTAEKLGKLKPATAYSYRTLADEYVIPSVGRIRIDKLTSSDVDEMTGTMADAGYAPNTIRLARSLLRTSLNAALREGLVGRNAVANSVAPNVKGKKRPTLTLEQARKLLGSLADETYGPIVETALWTGMRKGELLGLRWSDVDLQAQVIYVSGTLGRITGQGLVRGTPKTPDSRDTVPLVSSAVAALKRQRAAQAAARLELGSKWRGGDSVFHGPLGGQLDPSKTTKEWKTIRDGLGLPAVTFHDLRHTTATLLLSVGVALEVVSRILRHSSIVITADVYATPSETLTTGALEALERAINDQAAGG